MQNSKLVGNTNAGNVFDHGLVPKQWMTSDNIAGNRSALPALRWAMGHRVLDVGTWALNDLVQPSTHQLGARNNVLLSQRDIHDIACCFLNHILHFNLYTTCRILIQWN
jgi:hypothetical protein